MSRCPAARGDAHLDSPAPLDDFASLAPAATDVADQVLENLATREAVASVASLPPLQAEVLVLRVVAGLDPDAVARTVGRTGAVRVAAHRELRRLVQMMTEAGVTL